VHLFNPMMLVVFVDLQWTKSSRFCLSDKNSSHEIMHTSAPMSWRFLARVTQSSKVFGCIMSSVSSGEDDLLSKTSLVTVGLGSASFPCIGDDMPCPSSWDLSPAESSSLKPLCKADIKRISRTEKWVQTLT
jgi:hypothetical protein